MRFMDSKSAATLSLASFKTASPSCQLTAAAQDWLAGKRTLPSETLAYVRIVTGHPAEDWKRQNAKDWQVAIPGDTPCVGMTKLAAKPASQTTTVQRNSTVVWAVQLIADRSETNALASYSQIRKKFQAILGAYEPVVARTTVGMSCLLYTSDAADE